MARAAYKLPSVFVGCPYDEKKFGFTRFKTALHRLPFKWYYADTRLKTRQLLGILTSYIRTCDFSIFDASNWNPNVSLEIGLAEGNGANYYIVLNEKKSKDVPSDIQGLQRVMYQKSDGLNSKDLIPQLIRYLVREYTHPKNIYAELTGENRDKKFYFAMAVLAHFRDSRHLTPNDVTRAAKGTYLRPEARDEVLKILEDLGLISGVRRRGRVLLKNLYPDDLRIGGRR